MQQFDELPGDRIAGAIAMNQAAPGAQRVSESIGDDAQQAVFLVVTGDRLRITASISLRAIRLAAIRIDVVSINPSGWWAW